MTEKDLSLSQSVKLDPKEELNKKTKQSNFGAIFWVYIQLKSKK